MVLGVQGETIRARKPDRNQWFLDVGKTRGIPQRYDVYSCKDKKPVMKNVTAKEAAEFARVSENFVVMTSVKPAKNEYGRLATESGYYFTHHGVPVNGKKKEVKPVKKEPAKPPREMKYRFRLDAGKLNRMIKPEYTSVADFCRNNKLSYETVMKHCTEGFTSHPSQNRAATNISSRLGVNWSILYVRECEYR